MIHDQQIPIDPLRLALKGRLSQLTEAESTLARHAKRPAVRLKDRLLPVFGTAGNRFFWRTMLLLLLSATVPSCKPSKQPTDMVGTYDLSRKTPLVWYLDRAFDTTNHRYLPDPPSPLSTLSLRMDNTFTATNFPAPAIIAPGSTTGRSNYSSLVSTNGQRTATGAPAQLIDLSGQVVSTNGQWKVVVGTRLNEWGTGSYTTHKLVLQFPGMEAVVGDISPWSVAVNFILVDEWGGYGYGRLIYKRRGFDPYE
jgi:hypothetical protein